MTYDEFLLALVIFREAEGEGVDGMRGVGHVIANRVKAWHQTWHQVILGTNQFSSMVIRGDGQTVKWPPPNHQCFAIAVNVYGIDGTDDDNTGGALYYANEANITSVWYQAHVIADPAHPVTVKIGRQTFRV